MYFCLVKLLIKYAKSKYIPDMLKHSILVRIKKNMPLKRDLMEEKDVSQYTLEKWLRDNYPTLTEWNCLKLISHHLKLQPEDLVMESEEIFSKSV